MIETGSYIENLNFHFNTPLYFSQVIHINAHDQTLNGIVYFYRTGKN